MLNPNLQDVDSEDMLRELEVRGGHPGALAAAALLCVKKSGDYNYGQGHEDIHLVDRSQYFPFGVMSYAQMIHTKSQRFQSLTQKIAAGGVANHEGLVDTALDIINYAGFFVAYMEGRKSDPEAAPQRVKKHKTGPQSPKCNSVLTGIGACPHCDAKLMMRT